MKRIHIILIVLALVLIGGMLNLLLLHRHVDSNTPKGETFCLSEYQWEIQTYSVEQNVGEINEKKVAIKIAQSLWLEKYGVDLPEKKIKVAYDIEEECWHVYSMPSPNTLGGVLHVIIRKNGNLLAVWIDD